MSAIKLMKEPVLFSCQHWHIA